MAGYIDPAFGLSPVITSQVNNQSWSVHEYIDLITEPFIIRRAETVELDVPIARWQALRNRLRNNPTVTSRNFYFKGFLIQM